MKFTEFYEFEDIKNELIDFRIEYIKNEKIIYHLSFLNPISIEEYKKSRQKIIDKNKILNSTIKVEVRIIDDRKLSDFSIEEILKFFIWLKSESEQVKEIFATVDLKIENDKLIIMIPSEFIKILISENINVIKNLYKSIGINNLIIDWEIVDVSEAYNKACEKINNFNAELSEIVKQNIIPSSTNILHKQSIDIIKICDIDEKLHIGVEITTEGEIFNYKLNTGISKKNNREWKKVSFCLTDNKDSISCSTFINNSTKKLMEFKDGDYIKIKGKMEFNRFQKNVELIPKSCKLTSREEIDEKKDNESIKRVELNLHSKMSKMDGINEISEYIKVAKNYNHSAIGLTDHGGVQGFIDLEKYAIKNQIKPLYGIELNITEKQKIIFDPIETKLSDAVYVIFDLETTGLSSNFSKIIEIGAVKWKNGSIIDKYQTFIKINEPLSEFIKNLTGITDLNLNNGIDIKIALKEFEEFSHDTILVAHNATFDYLFLKRNYEKHMNKKYIRIVIDTLEVGRLLFPEKTRYGLKNLVNHYKIKFTINSHHRADYDAERTAELFSCMCRDLKELKIETIEELIAKKYKNKTRGNHAIIYAKNKDGLRELFEIVSIANTDGMVSVPRIEKHILEKTRKNLLIGATGCSNGEVMNAFLNYNEEEICKVIKKYDYIEVMPLSQNMPLINDGTITLEELKKIICKTIKLAEKFNITVVAVGNVHMVNQNDEYLKDILIASKFKLSRTKELENGTIEYADQKKFLEIIKINKEKYAGQFYKTTKEMLKEFSFLEKKQAYKIVVENTNKIADIIADDITIIKKGLFNPKIEGVDEKVEKKVWDKAHEIYGEKLPEIIEKRIEKELKSIIEYGFAVIYYISAKLVNYSLENKYLVGSRGSVGSSLVATLMNITEVNPMPPHYVCPKCKKSEFFLNGEYGSGYDLPIKKCEECNEIYIREGQNIPFETFLGFEGDKVPDIDLNFSGDFQAKAHEYIRSSEKLKDDELFDYNHAFRAGTISTIAEKTGYAFVANYLELIGKQTKKADIIRIAKKIEGIKRTTGQHPGGIIVVPKELSIYDFTPVQYPADKIKSEWRTTHFDFHSIHDNLLKLDILGHDDPTILKKLYDLTGHNPKEIDVTDPKILELFKSTKSIGVSPEAINNEIATLGIPEFGTNFVMTMLKETKPNTFSELVQISGLSHGTDVWNGNARDLIKDGTCTLENVIGCRDDIMVYLMKKGINSKDSFNMMEKIRRGQGITNAEEEMMLKSEIELWYIDSCKKIKYMFPKAHATAYVIMALRIAYYKVYYPIEYYSAYFSSRVDEFNIISMIAGTENIKNEILQVQNTIALSSIKNITNERLLSSLKMSLEMTARGYTIEPIQFGKSHLSEWIISENKKSLICPYSSLDGLGIKLAERIYQEYKIDPFFSQEDFKKRTKCNKTIYEKLLIMGVLKDLDENNQTDINV